MRDQQLKEFSEDVKKGFIDALGIKSSFNTPNNVVRSFKDALTGDECAIVNNGTEEICVLKSDL